VEVKSFRESVEKIRSITGEVISILEKNGMPVDMR